MMTPWIVRIGLIGYEGKYVLETLVHTNGSKPMDALKNITFDNGSPGNSPPWAHVHEVGEPDYSTFWWDDEKGVWSDKPVY